MKKRILSIVLTICMVFMFLPTTVFAANDDATALQDLLNNGGTVTLSKDYTIDATLNVKKNVTLDLNGHVIKMTGSGSVIYVESIAKMTMTDSNRTATHTDSTLPAGGVITGGNTTQSGGGVYVGSGCSMTMTGGTIYNCKSSAGGGGVYVYNSGSFTMAGGSIENCSAVNGGGVFVHQSTFTMESGTIYNCESSTNGGGIYVTSGTFNMRGGEIKNCYSIFGAGGLCILAPDSGSLSEFTMTDGIIENCTTKYLSESAAIGAGNSNIFANGGIVKGMVYLQPNSTIQTTSFSSYTEFYDKVTNKGTISGGVYYGGIVNNSGTINGTYYTVSFDLNGGSGSIPTQWYVNTDKATVLKPADPTKDGYQAFDGWYNGNTKYDFNLPVTQTITLKAKYKDAITYNISYGLDGGTATNPATYNVESDAITLNNPVKTGYTFTGWSGTGLTGENKMNVTIAKGSTGDRAYTAHYTEKNSFTVAFDTNGGSRISDKTGVKWTDTVLDGITAPTKDGWEFTGWKCGDKTVNANTKYSDLAVNDTVTSVTLIAQWKDTEKPVITRLENGKTYCDDVDFTVSDNDGIASVKAGDEVLTVGTNGKYTLEKGKGTVTVVATDKSDNETEVTVTVNDGHTGGTATCVAKAVCEYCGEEYGELDSNNHNLEKIPAKDATVTATGNKEYWHCKDCGKYFADEKGTNEIKLDDTIIAVNAWEQTVLRLQATASQTSVKLKWNAVPEADGYVIYWNKCGSKKAFKQVKEIESGKTLTWTHKNLKKGSWNRYYVKAYKVIDGKKSFIKTSNKIHLVTKGGKYTNVKKLKASVSSVTLKKGKTKALKIKQTYAEKNKKPTLHMRPLTYTTSDKTVATVTSKGVIKAKGKGSCYIYITGYSGVYTRVKVTVK